MTLRLFRRECPLGPQGSGWFQVTPTLRAGGEELPLDAVMCQTVLAKCLGPLPRWEATLRVAHEAGYNMIHFTPVQVRGASPATRHPPPAPLTSPLPPQELGASGSSYSIADQLRLNPRFGEGAPREATFADVENVVAKMRDEWGTLAICDIVLNHTANETPWLAEHPEATYNCESCPHLRPAALLDAALARLSADVARGALAAQGLPRRVATEEHVHALRRELAERRLPELRLHEMFQCDAAALERQFCVLARNK